VRAYQERRDGSSCLNKARADEMIFVLLGRDAAAPSAIRAWCRERIRAKKNKPGDPQITEALEVAGVMEAERRLAAPLQRAKGAAAK